MIKVIINADDFGLNTNVNNHIASAIEQSCISSTTILANTDTPEFVKQVYDKYRDIVSFGVHLNLTQGKSLTNSEVLRNYGIIDDNGDFTRKILKITSFEDDLKQAIKQEWMAQIARLHELGIKPSHIDGHHHVHGLLPLRDIIIDIARDYNIAKVRSRYHSPLMWTLNSFVRKNRSYKLPAIIENKQVRPAATIATGLLHRNPTKMIAHILREMAWRKAIVSAGINTTDYFGQYSTIFNKINLGSMLPKNCTIELMCHPGHQSYIAEEEAIMVNRLAELLDYKMISYNQL